MRELLSIGKVWELAQLERRTHGADTYDLVIVDSPAAGHGVGILRTPRTFAEIARVGPIAHQGRTIAATIADRDFTAVVAVATAEEMPVNETLWLSGVLAEEQLPLDAVIVNALYAERFRPAERRKLQSARRGATSPLLDAALGAALSEHDRAARQREQLARLAEGLGQTPLELPYLFSEEIGRPELERLADGLDAGLATLERSTVRR
jgi:anion-transporting  ArsA/GET3 family ATPase